MSKKRRHDSDPAAPRSAPDALLAAAFDVFSTRGYRAARLEEVADAAGLTKGAIYYHFEGKEDLLRQAVQRRHRALFEEMRSALDGQDAPAAARVRLALRRMWDHWQQPASSRAIRLVLGEVSVQFPALFRLWASEGPVAATALVRDLIEGGVAAGEFRTDVDPEVAARTIVSGLMLQATFHHLGMDEVAAGAPDPDRVFASAVDVFLHGLFATHGPRAHAAAT